MRVAAVVAVVGALLLAGCGDDKAGSDKLDVVASFYPVAEAALECGHVRLAIATGTFHPESGGPPTFLHRMVVDRSTFKPFAGPAERLAGADIDALNRLYQLGFRGGFPASVLEEGVYYGVRVRGQLVSAAGTHVINAREGVAVVGNVMTHSTSAC